MVLVVLKASFMVDGVTLIYSSQLLSETDPTSVDRKEEMHERIMSPSFLPKSSSEIPRMTGAANIRRTKDSLSSSPNLGIA